MEAEDAGALRENADTSGGAADDVGAADHVGAEVDADTSIGAGGAADDGSAEGDADTFIGAGGAADDVSAEVDADDDAGGADDDINAEVNWCCWWYWCWWCWYVVYVDTNHYIPVGAVDDSPVDATPIEAGCTYKFVYVIAVDTNTDDW